MYSVCVSCGSINRVDPKRVREARCGRCGTDLPAADRPRAIESVEDFQRLLAAAPVPVLVDFWAGWCGPCRRAAPEVDQLARDSAGALLVAKVDTEALPQLAETLGIRGIPTFVVFERGREVRRSSGYQPAARLRELALVG